MARSVIKGTKGKPVKKAKNRDQLKASIKYVTERGPNGSYSTSMERKNDGWNHINHTDKTKHGTTKSTIKNVEPARKPLKGRGYGARDFNHQTDKHTYDDTRKLMQQLKERKRHDSKFTPKRK